MIIRNLRKASIAILMGILAKYKEGDEAVMMLMCVSDTFDDKTDILLFLCPHF